jgi:hypothetical protein
VALDWSNERYVRLYRPGVDHRALCWQARAIWPLLLQEADGAGVIGARKGVAGLAKALDFPVEVVEAGIADLLDDGCLVAIPGGYCIRNYVEAQTATMTDNSRKARQREHDRALSALAAAAATVSQAGAQFGHETSRDVTDGHRESRSVTPSRAEPKEDLSLGCRAGAGAGARSVDTAPTPAPAPAPAPVPQQSQAAATAPPPRPTMAWEPDRQLGALVALAIDALNDARTKADPNARRIPLTADGDAAARALMDHLRLVPPAERESTLRHAIDVMVSHLAAEGKPVDDIRLGMLAGPNAWPRWRDGKLHSGGKRDGPRRQPSASRGQAPALVTDRPDGAIPL